MLVVIWLYGIADQNILTQVCDYKPDTRAMASIEQILQQSDNFSSLSAEPSFTLDDILKEPLDEQLQDEALFQEMNDDVDRFFEDQQQYEQETQPYDMAQTQKPKEESESQSESLKKQDSAIDKTSKESTNPNRAVRKWARLQDLPLLPQEEIQNMVYVSLKNVTQLFDLEERKGVGLPTCISATGSKFLAIGTSIGKVALFEIGVRGFKSLASQNPKKLGQVTSVAVSRDSRYMVAGFESGILVVWDLLTFKVVKEELENQSRIIKVLFCSQTYENFIVSNELGIVNMYTIQNKFWLTIKHQLLIDRMQDYIYYDTKYTKLQSKRQVIALCSLDAVVVLSFKPTIGIIEIVKRPEQVGSTAIPNCELGCQQNKDILCVSWGTRLFIYRFVQPTNYQVMESLCLYYTFEHPTTIHNLEFIAVNLMITIDETQIYRVVNLATSLQCNQCVSISTHQLEVETISQRFLKDKKNKYIKSYTNTMMNCSFDPKNKEIFFIAKNAVYRGRIEKWTSIVHGMIGQQRNWLQALKLCVELCRGNYNIFAEQFVGNHTTKALLCDIGKIYLKEKMNEILQDNPDPTSLQAVEGRAEEVYQTAIEYFICVQCEEYLFSTVFTLVKQKYYYEYYRLLLRCLEPFIDHCLIKKIPDYSCFLEVVEQYRAQPETFNKLIISLDQESLHYTDVVEICTRGKLYESLCYICAVNDDFISPANKILTHLNKLEEGPERTKVYQVLRDYIDKLVEVRYPNNKEIVADRRVTALKEIEIWISSKEALSFMIINYPQDIFALLTKLSHSLVKYKLEHFFIDLCQQLVANIQIPHQSLIYNSDNIQEHEPESQNSSTTKPSDEALRQMLNFLVGASLFKQIHYSKQLVKNVLQFQADTQVLGDSTIIGPLANYINFMRKYIIEDGTHNNNPQQQQIIQFFESQLLPSLDVHLRAYYLIICKLDDQSIPEQLQITDQDTLAKQILLCPSPQHRHEIVNLLLNEGRGPLVVEKYTQLLLKWAPEITILYFLERMGIEKVNAYLTEIRDPKYQYLIIRKILKIIRKQPPLITSDRLSKDQTTMKIDNSEQSRQHNRHKLPADILVSYIDSMCKYKKEKRVFMELNENPEDYENLSLLLLPVIERYRLNSCLAVIKTNQLHYHEAYNLYSGVYEEYFNLNFRKLCSHEHCHGRFMAHIFQLMLSLCYKMGQEAQWVALISNILKPLEKIDESKLKHTQIIDTIQMIYEIKVMQNHPFINELQDVIEVTIVSASREISMVRMAEELNKYTYLLGKTFILNCVTSTLKNSFKRVEGFQISKDMMVTEFTHNFSRFYQYKVSGMPVSNVCAKCGKQASIGKSDTNPVKCHNPQLDFILLSCGHSYHRACLIHNSDLSTFIEIKASDSCIRCTHRQFGDQSTPSLFSSSQIDEILQHSDPKQNDIPQHAKQKQDTRNMYKSLAFDDYMNRKKNQFEEFRSNYEKSLQVLRNY